MSTTYTEAHTLARSVTSRIPLLDHGVMQVPNGPTTANALPLALKLGNRYIDAASEG